MQAELINLTALAKFNKGTTPATRAKLDKLGVRPVQEVQMPSGRKFVLFDKVKAIKALEKSRAEREKLAEKKAAQVAKEAAKPVAKAAPQGSASELAKEVQELRKMMAQMLEHMTQPDRDAKKPQTGEATTEKQ